MTDLDALVEFLRARIAEDETEIRTGYGLECENVFSETRLLAECEAKRRMVKYANSWSGERTGTGNPPGAPYGFAMLRALAQVYKDHPDFNRHDWLI